MGKKARFVTADPVQRRWAYHGGAADVPAICARGLRPFRSRAFKRKYVYFSDEAELARDYMGGSDVLLRFPWPKNTRGFVFEDEGIIEYVAPRVIPPHEIEVEIDGRWHPLCARKGK